MRPVYDRNYIIYGRLQHRKRQYTVVYDRHNDGIGIHETFVSDFENLRRIYSLTKNAWICREFNEEVFGKKINFKDYFGGEKLKIEKGSFPLTHLLVCVLVSSTHSLLIINVRLSNANLGFLFFSSSECVLRTTSIYNRGENILYNPVLCCLSCIIHEQQYKVTITLVAVFFSYLSEHQ